MKIAFRKTNALGLIAGLFNRYTKWTLKTGYSHGGVVIGDQLWHTTRSGFLAEKFTNQENWDLFETPLTDKIASERLTKVLKMRYDPFSLLGFKLPFRFSDSKGLYCFEVQWLALTGMHPNQPVSPDTVMAELLRQINAPAHPSCFASKCGSDCDRGLSDPVSAKPCRVAAESDLSNFGLANIHLCFDGNLGNQQ